MTNMAPADREAMERAVRDCEEAMPSASPEEIAEYMFSAGMAYARESVTDEMVAAIIAIVLKQIQIISG